MDVDTLKHPSVLLGLLVLIDSVLVVGLLGVEDSVEVQAGSVGAVDLVVVVDLKEEEVGLMDLEDQEVEWDTKLLVALVIEEPVADIQTEMAIMVHPHRMHQQGLVEVGLVEGPVHIQMEEEGLATVEALGTVAVGLAIETVEMPLMVEGMVVTGMVQVVVTGEVEAMEIETGGEIVDMAVGMVVGMTMAGRDSTMEMVIPEAEGIPGDEGIRLLIATLSLFPLILYHLLWFG